MNISPLLKEAERLLKANPRDEIHDLSHHQRVWKNALLIVGSLSEPIDKNVLQVATMWHDVMISPVSLSLGSEGLLNETISYLRHYMVENDYDQKFQKAVISAIEHHNFLTKFQMSLEGKVLFDADKLDALNPVRYRKIIEALKNKQIPKVQIFLLTQAAKLWLKTMRNRYHFKKSKELHDQLIADLLNDQDAIQTAKEVGVDIVKLVK
ncbi:MAG TPA: HD domain-containing protein [Patescibacteria group bacterium]